MKKYAPSPFILKLGLISLFADISSEMLYPLHPIFLTTFVGASALQIGLMEGFAEGLVGLLKITFGRWSDRLQKRKIFVLVGYLLSALGKPLLGLAHSPLMAGTARVLDRFGKSVRASPRDALLDEGVPPEQRAFAFGWHRGLDSLGATLGPLLTLGFILYNGPLSEEFFRKIYLWALIPGLIAFLLIFSVQEHHPNPPKIKPEPALSPLPAKPSSISPEFRRFLWIWGLFSLGNSSDLFLLLALKANGFSLAQIVGVYSFYNFFYAISSPIIGHWADRFPKSSVLSLGLMLFSVVYAGFTFATSLWSFLGLFLLYGIYMGATDGVAKSRALELIPKDQKAWGLGLLSSLSGVNGWLSSLIAGALWDFIHPFWAFRFGAAMAIIAAIGFQMESQRPSSN